MEAGQATYSHPSLPYRWISEIEAEPGISLAAMYMLKTQRTKDPINYKECSLMIDAMAIRKHLDWNNKQQKHVGFVDLGDGDRSTYKGHATEALVIMAVGLRKPWKIPAAFYLIHGISAEKQKEMITSVIKELHAIKITVKALVGDGHPTNVKTYKLLGCDLRPNSLKTSFPHPCDATINVYTFFDVSHLMKNVRGALHALTTIKTPSGEATWAHIEQLHQLQQQEGLVAANKLTNKHVHFENQKMKVKLAVQTLSASVAAALLYANDLQLMNDCSPTSSFISTFDQLFDIMNSKTTKTTGFKRPLTKENIKETQGLFASAEGYIKSLKDPKGKALISGPRKQCFIGFIINMQSIIQLANELLESFNFEYVMTYRLSQDHLETYFSCIRQRGGFNNNPSAQQFIGAFRCLMAHSNISITNQVNCIPQDSTSLLHYTNKDKETDLDEEEAVNLNIDSQEEQLLNLTPFVDGVMDYVAGAIVKKIQSRVQCTKCFAALVTPARTSASSLVQMKDHGSLIVPSEETVKIVKHCERYIRTHLLAIKAIVPGEWNAELLIKIMSSLPPGLFPELAAHSLNTRNDSLETHTYLLIKLICTTFVQVRRKHITNLGNITIGGNSIRQKFTKEIIFHHQ